MEPWQIAVLAVKDADRLAVQTGKRHAVVEVLGTLVAMDERQAKRRRLHPLMTVSPCRPGWKRK